MQLRDLVPSIRLPTARWLRTRLRSAPPSSRVYQTYAEALRICDNSGYETDVVVEVVARKTEMLRDHLLATKPFQLTGAPDLLTLLSVVTTALSANRDVLRVLDFGGACGAHFFVVKAALGHILNLRWHVVETPAMCDKARALQTDELQFFEHQEHAVAAMDGVDLVYCSGALQYAPDPPAALAELTSHKAQYFVL